MWNNSIPVMCILSCWRGFLSPKAKKIFQLIRYVWCARAAKTKSSWDVWTWRNKSLGTRPTTTNSAASTWLFLFGNADNSRRLAAELILRPDATDGRTGGKIVDIYRGRAWGGSDGFVDDDGGGMAKSKGKSNGEQFLIVSGYKVLVVINQ